MNENLNPIVATVPGPVLTPKSKSSRKVIIIISLVIVLLLLGIGAYFYASSDTPSIDDSFIKFMKVEPIVVLPEENAYFDLIKLKGLISSSSTTSSVDFSRARDYLAIEKPSAEETKGVQELLQSNTKTIEIFEASKSKPKYYCDFVVNEDCNLNDLRNIALLKTLKADLLFREGKSPDAIKELFEVLDFGDKLQQNASTLITYLVYIAVEKTALTEIQKIVDSGELSFLDKTNYLEKIKTYSIDKESLKNAYKREFNYDRLTGYIDKITNDSLSPEEKKDFPVTLLKLKNKHTWKPNQTKLLWFNLHKAFIDNVDRPCGTDYDKYSEPFLILNGEDLKPTDENYIGKILFATSAASLNGAIKKQCELIDLKNKIEISLASGAVSATSSATSTGVGGPKVNKDSPVIIAEVKLKTYTSTDYGFEFNYPDGYSVSSEYQYIYVSDSKSKMRYTLTISENAHNLTPKQYVETALLDYNISKDPINKTISVNGLTGVETILRLGSVENRSVYFQVKNKMINIQYHLDSSYFENNKATTAQKDFYIKNGEKLVSSFKLSK